jgi:hypothetical protein
MKAPVHVPSWVYYNPGIPVHVFAYFPYNRRICSIRHREMRRDGSMTKPWLPQKLMLASCAVNRQNAHAACAFFVSTPQTVLLLLWAPNGGHTSGLKNPFDHATRCKHKTHRPCNTRNADQTHVIPSAGKTILLSKSCSSILSLEKPT